MGRRLLSCLICAIVLGDALARTAHALTEPVYLRPKVLAERESHAEAANMSLGDMENEMGAIEREVEIVSHVFCRTV